ncbi:response regulator [Alteribacillus sp. HJP-4]|uniref:response regulator n=1 Tax=Alteribacillus sp. HJP-4 TaxID=2775394 RepID=UPI0035CD29EF
MIRIGIAEDDFRIAAIHEELIERIDGFTCKAKVLTGSDTIQMLEQQEIDLLLLDVYMPDVSGTDLLASLREKFPDVDVIIISASTDFKHVQKSLHYGVFDYIVKPVSLERLESTLNEYQMFKKELDAATTLDQESIDRLKSMSKDVSSTVERKKENIMDLPKGIDSLTLHQVSEFLRQSEEGITADEMGRNLGASRTTARRYLEYLISENKAEAKPIYGIVGRPERRYFIKN